VLIKALRELLVVPKQVVEDTGKALVTVRPVIG
jgi:hypothetical protein